ncbi:DNA replication and repair protein RecF [Cytophagaceae bacterium DM2B3-1]|uniref:DNA replication and repair protein RecF n=1 Tax=Xanthocytophaga flava TaxID=3048013 RepID=A0ABT7CQ42_9BACT|nr:DNA replication and repair protein RecF [Xanthocytophaga flavus]MDJ1471179.1 DNA replication and repair protein RecF [Xanthocytophaga flavus]MDJ1495821.1 DNA replication and repair protein RecF [Xanthocytophaga flavus]
MYLERIQLLNFKNHEELSLTLSPSVNGIVGINGSGKTSLLDAIYMLALTKSAFSQTDAQCIRHGAEFFMIDGVFKEIPSGETSARGQQVTCSLKIGSRKVVMLDKKAYERLSEHIGRFPVVLISPDDTDLIRDTSELRRKFFDNMLSQLDHKYLDTLMQYNSVMKHRNSLLKQFYERNYFDKDLLETFDTQLLPLGDVIHQKRHQFIQSFVPLVQKYYAFISESREEVDLIYESELFESSFKYDYSFAMKRDLQLQRTTKGVHKDDFVFEISRYALKKFGSQGQQKSFVIALKLAQFEILQKEKGSKPLLLLDDIFDKLDDLRINKLIEMITNQTFGQLFITDARPERSRQIFASLATDVRMFEIEK